VGTLVDCGHVLYHLYFVGLIMDILTAVGIIGVIIGIAAGIVQVLDYLQKQREKRAAMNSVTPLVTSSGSTVEPLAAREQATLAQLRQNLIDYFGEGELRTLSFDLGIDYESLPGEGKADKARELVVTLQRHTRLAELIAITKRLRPQVDWGVWAVPINDLTTLPKQGIPHNLPRPSEFVGREAEKAQVHEALKSRSYLISIDGIGGIGKSSLALEVAYECLQTSQDQTMEHGQSAFDGFVWVTAKDEGLALNDILDLIARTLDYPGIAQQPTEEKVAAIRKLLATKSCLLIVDNFETVTDDGVADFLLRLPEPSKTLLTTREQKLRQARAISIRGLNETEALALIRHEGRRLGLQSVEETGDNVLLRLYQATGGAPLAIKWAIGQIKQKGQSLDSVLGALHDARGDIFEDIFQRSWSLLSPEARRVLMVMPLFVTSAVRPAIEAASDIHHYVLDEALGQAVQMWLVEATDELDAARRRFSVHPLTRSFATARLSEKPEQEQQMRFSLAEYYVAGCREKGRWGDVGGFPWIQSELANIISVLEWARTSHQWSLFTSIFGKLYYFLGTRGYWQERVFYGQLAIQAARVLGDVKLIAEFQHALAWILRAQGYYDEAERLLRDSADGFLSIGLIRDAIAVMITLVKTAINRGELDRARQITTETMQLVKQLDEQIVPSGLLSVMGQTEMKAGNLTAAQHLLLEALEGSRESKSGLASTSTSSRQIYLGEVALAQNNLEEAETYFRQALESSRQFMRQDNIAKANLRLVQVYARRDAKSAVELAHATREQFIRMGMKQELAEVEDFLQQHMMLNPN
jgi:tetratricopeptide (TPR) repeat protein